MITKGGPEWSYRSGGYNNYSISELLRPLQQTANLCGMRWMAPFVVHGVLPGDYEDIKATEASVLQEKAEELRTMVDGLDLDLRHSLEPLMPPHFS